MNNYRVLAACCSMLLAGMVSPALAAQSLDEQVRARSTSVEPKLIAWRRDIHQHPEMGNQETRTAKLVADHLRKLGLEVETGVAKTGVVGLLKGGKPGRTVALRADMDALPITEESGLPFASKVRGSYLGDEVGVMHACGHDAHTAMLMATAEVLAGMRDQLPGNVLFIFQPAEEGPSDKAPAPGDSWGARMMLEEGIFDRYKPMAVLGMHVMPGPSGEVSWREGATTASSDTLSITVTGKQGHGGMPWNTVDPIAASGLILSGLQTVVSRRANLTKSAAVVTVGSIHGGTGPNIVPEQVRMTGTIRTYDEGVREQVARDVKLSASKIAESSGATATVEITGVYPTTVNNAELARAMTPVITRAADGNVATAELPGASEDFSYYAAKVPGLFVFLGITPDGEDPATTPPNHSPRFFVDEKALVVGTQTMASMAIAVLEGDFAGETK